MAPAKAPTPEPLESSPEPDEPRPGLDDGSSSLSEPESIEARGHIENDSEAETERIDDTPRRRAVDVTNVTERAGEPTEHAGESDDDVLEDAVLPEDNERKRKRSSSALSSLADGLDADQPSKRHSSYDKMEVDVETVEEPDKQADEDSGEGAAAQTTEAADEAVDEAIDEAADEAEAPSKKKGKKGKKAKKEDQTPAEEDDEEVEEERKQSKPYHDYHSHSQATANTVHSKFSTRLSGNSSPFRNDASKNVSTSSPSNSTNCNPPIRPTKNTSS